MVTLRRGAIVGVGERRPGAVEIEVDIGGKREPAIAYPDLTGPVEVGDTVVVNTTAVDLGLGTGGVHFVVAVEGRSHSGDPVAGRIMKARYTPLQAAVTGVEETHGDRLEASPGLEGMPVVAAPLHSMLAPVAAGARAEGAGRIAYVMTDGAALAGPFSRLVPRLREAGLLDAFITSGQAFGGDLEAVTIWTALLAAREISGADVVIVADGPGNLGTDTKWGVSALGSGHALNAVSILGGRPLAALRISFTETRDRHRGLSHHSLTILEEVCLVPATIAAPILENPREKEALSETLANLPARYQIVEADGAPALSLLEDRGVEVESMGRKPADDPAFFLAAGAAGVVAGHMAARSNS